jgi:hypothetical protein
VGLFSRKPKQSPLPSYVGMPLAARLADPVWAASISAAGFDPTTADLVRVVDSVMVSSPSITASDGMPFISADTGILVVQRGRVGIAVPDATRILVVGYETYGAELNVGNTGMLKLVWPRAGSVHGIVFTSTDANTPEGREFGDALLSCIR